MASETSESLTLKGIGFLPLDEALASGAVFVIISRSDLWAEIFLEPAK